MTEVIKDYRNGTMDIVSDKGIKVGDHVETPYLDQHNRRISYEITNVCEQRKSKGEFKDESKRWDWAKCNVQRVN